MGHIVIVETDNTFSIRKKSKKNQRILMNPATIEIDKIFEPTLVSVKPSLIASVTNVLRYFRFQYSMITTSRGDLTIFLLERAKSLVQNCLKTNIWFKTLTKG